MKCAKESAGKHYGYSGTKIGNAHLKWAFSEAAVLSLRQNPPAPQYVARLAQKHGKAKALTILAHKLARAMYGMLSRGHAFDATKFFPAPAAAGRAIPTTDRPPETTASAPGRRRRAIRPDDAARSGPTRRVLDRGRYLTTPTIDASTGEIGPSDGDGVSMLSTIHAH